HTIHSPYSFPTRRSSDLGERTNTNGSKKFKQHLEKDDWHGLVEMAKEQEREGVHVLDVCVDYVGRDGVRDMKEVIKRYNEVLTRDRKSTRLNSSHQIISY